MKHRTAEIERNTLETKITVRLDLDGRGKTDIRTGIPFFDHMLTSLARHAGLDLVLRAQGDTEMDDHHTVEDVGLVLGRALDRALGGKKGIRRFGWALVPMDEALSWAALDISGRPYLACEVSYRNRMIKGFDLDLLEDFLRAFSTEARLTLHLWADGRRANSHHVAEAAFKALSQALKLAVALDPRVKGIPSIKGKI